MKLLFLLFGCLALGLLVQGQTQSGFISIDCGISEGSDYVDDTTSISYTSDANFIDTGTNYNISQDFIMSAADTPFLRQLSSVRSFPQGIKNCYTFKPAQAAKGNNYLIRAYFMYGNYDSQNQPPEFSLYLEADKWDTVKLANASHVVMKEIIHVPATDYIHVCLVNTSSGTPFISALELRPLNNTIYKTESGSLALRRRLDVGSLTNRTIRYQDDPYDRIWEPNNWPYWQPFSAAYGTGLFSSNDYKIPSSVMMTAVRPVNGLTSLDFSLTLADSSQNFYLYMHFAEIESLQPNQLRKFDISLNGDSWDSNIVPLHLSPISVVSTRPVSGVSRLTFSINMASDSTLPPILNALEIYMVKEFLQSLTNQNDVDAIRNIKSDYRVERNWQGDPCAPKNYLWDGLECSYDNNIPTIISLNLSSSSLSGNIATSLSNLISLQYLDLSNNSLTGPVPDFLSQLRFLKTLNLSGNYLTGSVPSALMERSNNGSLSLSLDKNPGLCWTDSCKKKKKNVVVPLVASIISFVGLLGALAMLWLLRRRRHGVELVSRVSGDGTLESKNKHFSYSEVVSITNDFQKVIGKGGFGTVYGGQLKDGTQVAVKMLSQSSTQGSKQFRTEAQLLTRVHHRNLAILIGYCDEGSNMGLIYEYMAKGNLQEHLSGAGNSTAILTWEQRLGIAIDAAQALEYLHNGCKPPIIHRDVKTANILLNEEMQAKVADFGLSRILPLEDRTHVSTAVVGTVGYLDPEYYISSRLNEKSDVYSFGIVLLELITGQPAIVKGHDNTHIVKWINPMLERGEIRNIVDPKLEGEFEINSVWKAVETAMACVPSIAIQRPTMSPVLVELKECLEMEKARETTNWIGREDDQEMMTTSTGSCEMVTLDIETSIGPQAR